MSVRHWTSARNPPCVEYSLVAPHNESNPIRYLSALGVSVSSEEAYVTLLKTLPVSAQTIDETSVPPAALDELVRFGLLSHSGDGIVIVPARLAVERWSVQLEDRAREARSAVDHLSALFPGHLHGSLKVLQGREAATAAYLDLQVSARESIESFDRPPYFSTGGSSISPVQAQMSERGVKYRTIYQQAILDDSFIYAGTRLAMDMGEEARIYPEVPVRMIIADRRRAILLLPYDTNPDTGGPLGIDAIVVEPSPLLDSLCQLFDLLWKLSTVLKSAQDPEGLSATEAEVDRQILELLSTGVTDASIARSLGISQRTVGRRINRLQERLGATSRFQLGVKASTQNLI